MGFALKHIPCPAGNACSAFKCIFGHPNEPQIPQQEEEGVEKPLEQQGGKEIRRGSGNEPQWKRLKTESESKDATACNEAPSPRTASKSVSSPPLSKSRAKRNTYGRTPSSTTELLKTNPVFDGKKDSAVPSQESRPQHVKVESLNPRLLKSSPASHEIRLKLLKSLHAEFVRLNSELQKDAKNLEQNLICSEQRLIRKALDIEQTVALEKSAVYANVMKNKVIQHRRMGVRQWVEDLVRTEQAEQPRQGAGVPRNEESLLVSTGLPQALEVDLLSRIGTPIDALTDRGYVSEKPSVEAIKKVCEGTATAKGWEVCDRCQQRFRVFPGRREQDGALTSGGNCSFHWGKTYVPEKALGDRTRIPKRYQCCWQEIGESSGCFTHDHHVYKFTNAARLASVLQFAETPPNPSAPLDRAVCFDCEMSYTVYGMELIRLTATSWPAGEELLDVLVQPLGEVLDLNSRFSGVWSEDMAQAEPFTADDSGMLSKGGTESCSEEGEIRPAMKRLRKVSSPTVARDLLFSLISPSTPLIGHGLENDLNAARIIHPVLIDTVLLFPHRAGLPYRQGLKKLMEVHLRRKIQQQTGPVMRGHDSAEDARAAGELVRFKIMSLWQDMKRAGWRLVEDALVAPDVVA